MIRKFFNVGDEAWFIPGWADNLLIAIKVKITEIDDFGDYWVDEPIGEDVPWWSLLTKEEAEAKLKKRTIEYLAHTCLDGLGNYENARVYKPTLKDYRVNAQKTIMRMIEKMGNKHQELSYPIKSDADWFSVTVSDEEVLKRFSELTQRS